MAQRTVITVGNFDGVHRGHQAILAHARNLAQTHGMPLIAITFDPFPMHILRPQQAPARLSDRDQRAALLHQAGADKVLVIEPTSEFLALDAATFLNELVRTWSPAYLVEGANFRFGKGRGGDVKMLAQWGAQLGFEVQIIEPVEVTLGTLSAVPVSSSLVRWLLQAGRVHDAGLCLGRPYSLSARVIQGEQRGRTLGFPTANLDPALLVDRIVPCDGVYAAMVELPDKQQVPAAVSIGHKPTFGKMQKVIEAHLLNYQGDLYDQTIQVNFLRWVREQMSFTGLPALVDQIQRDVMQVRQWHAAGMWVANR